MISGFNQHTMEDFSLVDGIAQSMVDKRLLIQVARPHKAHGRFSPGSFGQAHIIRFDIQSSVSMGKTFADFYKMTGKPANMHVALGVHGRDFIELFLERMEQLTKSIQP